MGFGGGKSKSSSKPVTWEQLLHPEQKKAITQMGPLLTLAGVEGIRGVGISPEERARQTAMLSGSLADYAAGLRTAALDRASSFNQRGGVVSGAMSNIDAAKIMAYGEGLRSIEDMNQQLAQQKLANLLSFVTWNPPVSQKSESSGFGFKVSASG